MAYLALLMPILLQTGAGAAPAPTLPATRIAAAETATTPPIAAKSEKVICKRRPKTGSLAGFEKSCHTKAEWEKIGDQWREAWQEVQGTKGSTHGG